MLSLTHVSNWSKYMLKKKSKFNFVTIFALVVLTVILLMVVFPSLFTSYDPLEVNMEKKLLTPCGEHILGTDEYGRDIFCRIVYGARSSVSVNAEAPNLKHFS